jgi:hypothetical protein
MAHTGRKYIKITKDKRVKDVEKITTIICQELRTLRGRVSACEKAGIAYDTFVYWMETKPKFADAVKKAEAHGDSFGKEYAVKAIFAAMPKAWQSAAWWLERKHKQDFALLAMFRNQSDIQGTIDKKETAFDVKKALFKKPILPDADEE